MSNSRRLLTTLLQKPKIVGEKLSTMQIIDAWICHDSDALRQQGYNPKNLYESGKSSFENNQKIRAKMQYSTMLRFQPTSEEVALYEKSGDVLSEHGYAPKAIQHWEHAYNNNHRPYAMTVKLGHGFLTGGNLDNAEKVFGYQASVTPNDSVIFNELGVTKFMRATQQKDLTLFYRLQRESLTSFKRSSILESNAIVSQNYDVASLLTPMPMYKKPYQKLNPQVGMSTRMIDSIMHDLDKNRNETKGGTAVGWTVSSDPKGGAHINPTFTPYSYQVPRLANEFALNELAKLKSKEFQIEDAQGALSVLRK